MDPYERLEQIKEECRYSDDVDRCEEDPELGSVDSLIEYKNTLEEELLRMWRANPIEGMDEEVNSAAT